MRIVFHLLLLTSSIVCGDLNVDKFLAALGTRSSSLTRDKVVSVLEKHADQLNVSAISHLDVCTSIIEELSNTTYPPDDPIHTLFNATDIQEIFDFIIRINDRTHTFVFEKRDIIDKTLDKMDWEAKHPVGIMVNKITKVIGNIGKLQNVTENDIEIAINELKSKILGLYLTIPPALQVGLERAYCFQTLTEILKENPVAENIIRRFEAAKSIFVDEFIHATKKWGNYSEDRAIEIFKSEAERLNTPVQEHIERCTTIHNFIYFNVSMIDNSLKDFNQQNLRGMELNTTFDLHLAMLDEAPEVWDHVLGLRSVYLYGYHHLNEEGKLFMDRIFQIAKDGLLYAIHNRKDRLTSQIFIELILHKAIVQFRNLSMQLKIDVESSYCLFTSQRIFNGSEKTIKMIEYLHSSTN